MGVRRFLEVPRSLEACQWIQYFDQLPAERARTYRCVETLLQLESSEAYLAHLQLIYGASSLANAQALIKGELRFWNLASPHLGLETCVLHQSLLTAYQKVHPELK